MSAHLEGLDAPRPLPVELRARLERALVTDQVRPLTPTLGATLTTRLEDPVADLLSDLDAPRALPPAQRVALQRTLATPSTPRWQLATAVALAAAAVVAMVFVLPGQFGSRLPADQLAAGGDARPGTAPVAPRSTPQTTPASDPTPADVLASGPLAFPPSTVAPRTPAPVLVVVPAVSVLPTSAPADGGTWVDLAGSSLKDPVSVTFGGVPSPQLVVVSAERLRVLTPAHLAGDVLVQVTTKLGASTPVLFHFLG